MHLLLQLVEKNESSLVIQNNADVVDDLAVVVDDLALLFVIAVVAICGAENCLFCRMMIILGGENAYTSPLLLKTTTTVTANKRVLDDRSEYIIAVRYCSRVSWSV